MKYLMLIYGNEQVWNSVDAETFVKLVGEVDAFNATLRETGEFVDAQADGTFRIGAGEPGKVTMTPRDSLCGSQHGTADDPYGWRYPLHP